MARVRCITEMGMGVDVHGKDATKAARRAVSDAIRHSSLGFFRMVGKTSKDMFVDVTIGVPDPEYGERVAAFVTLSPDHTASEELASQIVVDVRDQSERNLTLQSLSGCIK